MGEAENSAVTLPIVPLKGKVFFPYILMPLPVGRPTSVAAVEAAASTEEREIVVFAQRDPSVEVPGQQDLYTIGTKAIIKKILRPGEDFMELIAQGMERVVLIKMEKTEPFLEARVRRLPLPEDKGTEVEALHLAVLDLAVKAMSLLGRQAKLEILPLLSGTEDPLQLVDLAASILSLEIQKEQDLLEAETVVDALRLLHTYLTHEVQVLELRNKIASHAVSEMSNEKREDLLRQSRLQQRSLHSIPTMPRAKIPP
jgi:ATP-dependent Lon protease